MCVCVCVCVCVCARARACVYAVVGADDSGKVKLFPFRQKGINTGIVERSREESKKPFRNRKRLEF